MCAMKASWVGQTYALATSNDSGGRKSRIRRSKEERKAMVESFVKRYQILNDGNFPSLNLTHKEVGGSFYTVREIVREIIQENKVLGPARFSSEVENDDTIPENYSLGSIALEPPVFSSVNELDVVSKHQESESAGLTLEGNGYYTNHQDVSSVQCSREHQADEMSEDSDELVSRKSVGGNDQQHASLEPPLTGIGQYINENHKNDGRFANVTGTNGVSEECDKLAGEESLVSETSDGDKQMELVGACNAKLTLPTQELVVETFPLRPVIKEIDDMSTTSTGSRNVINTALKHLGTKHDEICNGTPYLNKFDSSDSLSDTVTAKEADGSEHAEVSDKMIQHEEANSANKTLEMLDSSEIKVDSPSLDQVCMDKIKSHSGLSSKPAEQTKETEELEPKNGPKETTYKEASSSGTSSKNINKGPASAVANGNYTRRDNKITIEVSPTVDRIDLESWESQKTSNQETNSLLAFLKDFMDAFVKIWS